MSIIDKIQSLNMEVDEQYSSWLKLLECITL